MSFVMPVSPIWPGLEDLQVLKSIIGFDAISVMDNLATLKRSLQVDRHDSPVFLDLPSGVAHRDDVSVEFFGKELNLTNNVSPVAESAASPSWMRWTGMTYSNVADTTESGESGLPGRAFHDC